MCWTTKLNTQKLIADRNIDIFKVCSIRQFKIVSVYWGREYKLNTAYVLPIELEVEVETMKEVNGKIRSTSYSIHQAFHSYSPDCKIILNPVSIAIWYDTTFLDSYGIDCVKVLGFIPKGSTYYINEWGEYVSNAICLTEIKKLQYVLD